MNKYSLTIEEHIEEPKSFNTKSIIHIEGNSITELLAKLPLGINEIHLRHIEQLKANVGAGNLYNDDIPF